VSRGRRRGLWMVARWRVTDLQLSSGDDGGCSEMLGAGAGGNVYGSYRGFYLGGDEQMPSAHKRKLQKEDA
jgi:hypothetical protein